MIYVVKNIRKEGRTILGTVIKAESPSKEDWVVLGDFPIKFLHNSSSWTFSNPENDGSTEKLFQFESSTFFLCATCGKIYNRVEGMKGHQTHYCGDCIQTCPLCGKKESKEYLVDSPDGKVCRSCFDRFFTTCSKCGKTIRTETGIQEHNNGRTYCPDCAETYLTRCPSCLDYYENTFFSTDEELGRICRRCYDHLVNNTIQGYHCRPDLNFFGEGNKHFGLELEVSGGGQSHENARKVRKIIGKEHVYFNRDGSINNGFEIITHPHNYEEMMALPWEQVCNVLLETGYINNESSCGTHVHVSRSCFGNSGTERDLNYSKILFFFEKYWTKILKFSRRKESEVERWASRYGFDMPDKILEKAKSSARYRCVNLNNSNTIEFRVFKGTIDPSEIRAIIEFCELLTKNVKTIPVKRLPVVKFSDYFKGMSDNLLNKFIDRGCLPRKNDKPEISFEDAYASKKFIPKSLDGTIYLHDGSVAIASITKEEFCLAYGIEGLIDLFFSEQDKARAKEYSKFRKLTIRPDIEILDKYYAEDMTDYGINSFIRKMAGKKIDVTFDPSQFAKFNENSMFVFSNDIYPFSFTEIMFEELHERFDGARN